MSGQLALIAGSGGVLGRALRQELSSTHRVIGLRRSVADAELERRCDLSDPAAVRAALEPIGADVDLLIYNAARLVRGPFLELPAADFEAAWRVSLLGAVACAQAVLPGMLARGRGVILISGATGSTRGSAGFSAFAAAKFALRGLAQSLARELQPEGVHVVHVVLDGLLGGSDSVGLFGGSPERTLDPSAVAKAYRWLAEQPRNAWTHEIDLRHWEGKL